MKKIVLSFYLFVVVLAAVYGLVFMPIMNKILQPEIEDELVRYSRYIFRGAYHMLIQDIQEMPMEKWPARIEALKPGFGYPIGIDLYKNIDMPDKYRADFFDGKIIVTGKGLLCKRVDNSPYALTFGQIRELKIEFSPLTYGAWAAAVFLIVGIFALIWVLPFWRKLRKIGMAAAAFGNGRFDIRAEVPKYSSLAHLAVAFNGMAERIRHLIDSHKDLINSVSHELRTPISRIRFGMEMLKTVGDASDRQRCLQDIMLDVGELEALVSELLAYARFDREIPEIILKESAIGPWLAGEVNKTKAGAGSLAWECRFGPSSVKLMTRFEKRFMGRALGNLLRNAIRYAESRIQVVLETENGECLIHVDDDGPGIPDNERDRIFKPFVRLDADRDRRSGGYGLGLAIVDRIAAFHGGRVDISDSPLGGARFTIRWPVSWNGH